MSAEPWPRPTYWPQMRREHFEAVLARDPVVVVPVGSIEQHGPHCPVDVDLSGPLAIARLASERATDFPLVVAQEVPFGFTHYNQGFPGTINLSLETFIAMMSDVLQSIHDNGFDRIVVMNGHGGNHHPLKAIATKMGERDVFCLAFSHWDLVAEEMAAWGEVERRIGHAGEWETSIQLHLREHLVDRSKQVAEDWVPSVDPAYASFASFPERQRETPHGVMGDPRVATAEKGAKYVDLAATRLVELARAYRLQSVRHYRHAGTHQRR
ncbi:MAG: creatininase family protein [bacterium]|nr:creatininase family protein [bacterium]